MTDRELLELAAKAAGIDVDAKSFCREGLWMKGARGPDNSVFWNPLTDDGDALRLAVKLKLNIAFYGDATWAGWVGRDPLPEGWGNVHDGDSATRRAIVRAAAEIGKELLHD